MKLKKQYVRPMYIVIQVLFFMVQALIFNYATVYMMDRGFSSTKIGFMYAANSLLVILALMWIPRFVRKTGVSLSRFCAVCYVGLFAAAAALWLLPLEEVSFVLLLLIVFTISNTMYTAINAIYRGYHDRGIEMNYPVARGIGSASFTAATFIAGFVLAKVSPRTLPGYYMIPALLLALCLWIFNAPNTTEEPKEEAGEGQEEKRGISLFREYPHFILFIIGIGIVERANLFLGNYMILVVQRVGGNTANLGLVLSIGTLTELPAMLAYRKISQKVGNRKLLLIAGWIWTLKILALLLAPNIYVIYVTQLIQFFGASMYLPAAAKHQAHVIPRSEFLKGQSLVGIISSAGGLLSSLVGGFLIERYGIYPVMVGLEVFCLLGAVLFTFAIRRSLVLIPSVKK